MATDATPPRDPGTDGTALPDTVAGWVRGLQPRAAAPTSPAELPDSGAKPDVTVNIMDMVLDIPVRLSVELGRTKIAIKDILQLKPGSVVELDTLAVDLVDVLVNGHLIAQGEIVVSNDKFGIRLIDVVTAAERLKRLSKA